MSAARRYAPVAASATPTENHLPLPLDGGIQDEYRILNGQFTAVQRAVGTAKANQAGAAFLRDFVEEAKTSGLVARLIERHHVRGLSVARRSEPTGLT